MATTQYYYDAELKAALKPRLTDELLGAVAEAAMIYGHTGDYVEVVDFVDWLYSLAGKTEAMPEIDPPYRPKVYEDGSRDEV